MIRIYIEEFVIKYGLKNGIVLTELCKGVFNLHEKILTNNDCIKFLQFLTFKQIRIALEELVNKNCIIKETKHEGFKRESKYYINEEIYDVFLKEIFYQ